MSSTDRGNWPLKVAEATTREMTLLDSSVKLRLWAKLLVGDAKTALRGNGFTITALYLR